MNFKKWFQYTEKIAAGFLALALMLPSPAYSAREVSMANSEMRRQLQDDLIKAGLNRLSAKPNILRSETRKAEDDPDFDPADPSGQTTLHGTLPFISQPAGAAVAEEEGLDATPVRQFSLPLDLEARHAITISSGTIEEFPFVAGDKTRPVLSDLFNQREFNSVIAGKINYEPEFHPRLVKFVNNAGQRTVLGMALFTNTQPLMTLGFIGLPGADPELVEEYRVMRTVNDGLLGRLKWTPMALSSGWTAQTGQDIFVLVPPRAELRNVQISDEPTAYRMKVDMTQKVTSGGLGETFTEIPIDIVDSTSRQAFFDLLDRFGFWDVRENLAIGGVPQETPRLVKTASGDVLGVVFRPNGSRSYYLIYSADSGNFVKNYQESPRFNPDQTKQWRTHTYPAAWKAIHEGNDFVLFPDMATKTITLTKSSMGQRILVNGLGIPGLEALRILPDGSKIQFEFRNPQTGRSELRMLVLSRKVNEEIVIGGNIRVRVVGIKGSQVRIGITAPGNVPVLRDELQTNVSDEIPLPVRRNGQPVNRIRPAVLSRLSAADTAFVLGSIDSVKIALRKNAATTIADNFSRFSILVQDIKNGLSNRRLMDDDRQEVFRRTVEDLRAASSDMSQRKKEAGIAAAGAALAVLEEIQSGKTRSELRNTDLGVVRTPVARWAEFQRYMEAHNLQAERGEELGEIVISKIGIKPFTDTDAQAILGLDFNLGDNAALGLHFTSWYDDAASMALFDDPSLVIYNQLRSESRLMSQDDIREKIAVIRSAKPTSDGALDILKYIQFILITGMNDGMLMLGISSEDKDHQDRRIDGFKTPSKLPYVSGDQTRRAIFNQVANFTYFNGNLYILDFLNNTPEIIQLRVTDSGGKAVILIEQNSNWRSLPDQVKEGLGIEIRSELRQGSVEVNPALAQAVAKSLEGVPPAPELDRRSKLRLAAGFTSAANPIWIQDTEIGLEAGGLALHPDVVLVGGENAQAQEAFINEHNKLLQSELRSKIAHNAAQAALLINQAIDERMARSGAVKGQYQRRALLDPASNHADTLKKQFEDMGIHVDFGTQRVMADLRAASGLGLYMQKLKDAWTRVAQYAKAA